MVDILRLSAAPERHAAARALLDDYLRLPDSWAHAGGVPDRLPPILAADVLGFPGTALPPSGETFVAADGAAAVGVAMLVIQDPDTASIKRLYVVPGARRRGIGQRLAIACIEHAATLGCSRIVLDVLPSRTAAIRLYESLGFGETSSRTAYPMPMRFLSRSTG